MSLADREIRAAGAVPWRQGATGLEIAVVHRPRYDDWSFPKGKAVSGESDEECAMREVFEETGLLAELGAELGIVHYEDRFGRPKVVRYWAMAVPDDDVFVANDEVDDLRWVEPSEARRVLSYGRDIGVLDGFIARAAGGPGTLLE